MKKGQANLVLIIGVIIAVILVAIIIKLLFDIGNSKDEARRSLGEPERLQSLVEGCMRKEAERAVSILGSQGRIYPQLALDYKGDKVSFLYYKGRGFIPFETELHENEISRYVAENIGYCIDRFSSLPFGVSATGDMFVDASLTDDSLGIDVTYPLEISGGHLSDFSTTINVSFLPMLAAARDIYNHTAEDPAWIDVSYMRQLPFEVSLQRLDTNTVIYEMSDPKGLDGRPFRYRFAMRYII